MHKRVQIQRPFKMWGKQWPLDNGNAALVTSERYLANGE